MKKMRLAVVVSRFNTEVTNGLLEGARAYLKGKKIILSDKDVFYAPGAFEIPLIAKKLAKTKKFHGVICLGAVIKGETAHFEFISIAATLGIQLCSLETGIPITFGILTTYNDHQAVYRSKKGPENKGREAAAACVESLEVLSTI